MAINKEMMGTLTSVANKPIIWGKHPRESWVFVMVIVTALYLIIEFGFNSRLLDVVGGMPDAEAVESIEVYGRLISGFALALAFWPMIIKSKCDRGEPLFASLPRVIIISSIVITAVFIGQKKMVDWIVESSTPQMRYTSSNLVAVQNALVGKGVQLEGLEFEPDQLNQPDGKAFLAIFPLLALSTKDIDEKIQSVKPQILHIVIDNKRGGHAQSYNNFIESRKKLIELYNDDYLKGCEKYNTAINSIKTEQDNAWTSYKKNLTRKRLNPSYVPKKYWSQVRRDVISSGVGVSENWIPSDRIGFNKAIENKIMTEAINAFNAEIKEVFPNSDAIPPNLNKEKFFNHPSIQNYWREKLNYPNFGKILPVNLPPQEEAPIFYKESIYKNIVEADVNEMLKKYNAPVDSFSDGKSQEAFGKNGVRALVVPPIALMFSILGALVHIFKLSLLLILLVFGCGFHNGFIKTICVVGLAILLLASFYPAKNSTITNQPLYNYFETRGLLLGDGKNSTIQGWIIVHFARSTIHAQKLAYPIFEKVRKNLLFNYKFGYNEKSEHVLPSK